MAKSKKALKFFMSTINIDGKGSLPSVTDEGVSIEVIDDGHLAIAIRIDEKTTAKDIRDAIPLALKWRERLLEY